MLPDQCSTQLHERTTSHLLPDQLVQLLSEGGWELALRRGGPFPMDAVQGQTEESGTRESRRCLHLLYDDATVVSIVERFEPNTSASSAARVFLRGGSMLARGWLGVLCHIVLCDHLLLALWHVSYAITRVPFVDMTGRYCYDIMPLRSVPLSFRSRFERHLLRLERQRR